MVYYVHMIKQIGIIVILGMVATGIFLFVDIPDKAGTDSPRLNLSLNFPSFFKPSFNIFDNNKKTAEEAWTILQNYSEFARAHNLEGVRSLSHQTSEICNDPARIEECELLMDNIAFIIDTLA